MAGGKYGGDAYDLIEPPTPDKGTVEWVELDHRNGTARVHHSSDCQACGEPVQRDREHVLAMVRLGADGVRAPALLRS